MDARPLDGFRNEVFFNDKKLRCLNRVLELLLQKHGFLPFFYLIRKITALSEKWYETSASKIYILIMGA